MSRTLTYKWRANDGEHELRLAPVPGPSGKPHLFGVEPQRLPIEIRDFHMQSTPVTQALWTLVMGANPVERDQPRHPVTNVSWEHITGPGGFLERINASPVLAELVASGGPRWTDGLCFSGSNEIDEVAWYGPRFGAARRFVCRVLGWRIGWRVACRFRLRLPTHPHEVATKAPNQLGLYDLCGNVWDGVRTLAPPI